MRRVLKLLAVIFLLIAVFAFSVRFPLPVEAKMPVLLTVQDSYYDVLETKEEQFLYEQIGHSILLYLSNAVDTFVDTELPLNDYEDRLPVIAHAYLYDHPEYSSFWYKCDLLIRNNRYLSIQPTSDAVSPVASDWYVRQVSNFHGTKREIAKEAFLTLASRFQYDYDQTYSHSNDDYGLLTNGVGCCQSFSFAYKRMMDAAGIPCVVMTCHLQNGTYHMMDLICLGHVWVVCDVTGAAGCTNMEDQLAFFCMDETALSNLSDIRYIPTKTEAFYYTDHLLD